MAGAAGWKNRIVAIVRDVVAVFLALRDPKVPWHAKALGVASVLYLLAPIDIIPDPIPVIGWLDDLAMVPLLAYLASRLIRVDIMDALREKADRLLLRLGPKLTYLAIAFVLFWLALAAVGGWLFVRNWRG